MKRILFLLTTIVILMSFMTTSVSGEGYKILGPGMDASRDFHLYLHKDYSACQEEIVGIFPSVNRDWLSLNQEDFVKIRNSEYKPRNYPEQDGNSVVYFQADKHNRYLGQTSIWYKNGHVYEVDMNVNPAVQWSLKGGDTSGNHMYSAVLHEFGHMLGLGHAPVANSCMKSHLQKGEVLRITEVDKKGFQAIYNRSKVSTGKDMEKVEIEDGVQVIYRVLPEVSLTDLVESSNLIVRGNFVEKSEAVHIQEAHGDHIDVFRKYTIQVNEVFKNDTDFEGGTIEIQIECRDQEHKKFHDDLDDLSFQGDKLYFLFKPTDGGKHVTTCPCYLLPYSELNIFEVDDATNTATNGAITIDMEDIPKNVELNTGSSVEDNFHNELKANYEKGLFSAELYEEFLHQGEGYGTIVSDDCGCMGVNHCIVPHTS